MLTFDPLWPWSSLVAYLQSAPLAVAVAALVAGLIVFCLPIVAHLRPGGTSPRQIARGAVLALTVLFSWGFLAGGSSGGFMHRLYGLGMWALLMAPFGLAGLTIWTYLGTANATPRRIAVIL